MLINNNIHGYSSNKKYVVGRGFVDTMSSALKNVGSYLSTNKDLMLKPLLGGVGTLGAKALSEGIPALINRIANKNKNKLIENKLMHSYASASLPSDVDLNVIDDPIYKKILQDMQTRSSTSYKVPHEVPQIPISNIIGSGCRSMYKKLHKKRGSGIKKIK